LHIHFKGGFSQDSCEKFASQYLAYRRFERLDIYKIRAMKYRKEDGDTSVNAALIVTQKIFRGKTGGGETTALCLEASTGNEGLKQAHSESYENCGLKRNCVARRYINTPKGFESESVFSDTMSLTKLSVELVEKIGGLLNTREANHPVHFTPPVNSIQGAFNRTLALRNNEIKRTSFATIAGMIHRDDLISGGALFYALSRVAPPHHILDIIERCPQALSTRDINHNSVLHVAIKGKYRLEVLQLVCGAPEDWRAKKMAVNKTQMTPMHMALEAKADYEVIEFLLDGGRDVLSMENTNGDLPLHCAIRNVAALRVVALLIDTEDGHVLMSQNRQENLPLHLAGEFGVSERGVIPLLSLPEIHSDVRQKLNEDSHTPLYLAVSSRQDISILKLLMDLDKNVLTMGRIPLHLAVSERASFEVTKLLIDADKTVLTKTCLSYYPFHIAIQYRASMEIMELLLDDDWVCIRTPIKNGKTALHIACETGSTFDVIQFLVEKTRRCCLAKAITIRIIRRRYISLCVTDVFACLWTVLHVLRMPIVVF